MVILGFDCVDNSSKISVDAVKSLVSKSPIKLYTIGIGSQRDYDGRYLKSLAKSGKGQAHGASSAKMLNKIYEEIDRLEVSKIDDKKVVQHTYLYTYPLILSILLLLFFIYFRSMRSM